MTVQELIDRLNEFRRTSEVRVVIEPTSAVGTVQDRNNEALLDVESVRVGEPGEVWLSLDEGSVRYL